MPLHVNSRAIISCNFFFRTQAFTVILREKGYDDVAITTRLFSFFMPAYSSTFQFRSKYRVLPYNNLRMARRFTKVRIVRIQHGGVAMCKAPTKAGFGEAHWAAELATAALIRAMRIYQLLSW